MAVHDGWMDWFMTFFQRYEATRYGSLALLRSRASEALVLSILVGDNITKVYTLSNL